MAASLPSAAALVAYLGEAVVDGGGGLDGDTPIGTMEAGEVPVPTHARMPSATAYEVFLAKLKHPGAAEVRLRYQPPWSGVCPAPLPARP